MASHQIPTFIVGTGVLATSYRNACPYDFLSYYFSPSSLKGIEILLIIHNVSTDTEEIEQRACNSYDSAEDKVIYENYNGHNNGGVGGDKTHTVGGNVLCRLKVTDTRNNIKYTNDKEYAHADLKNADDYPNNSVEPYSACQSLKLFIGESIDR